MDICKNMESLIMKNCYGIDFRSWRKELRTREKTKQTPCKLPDRVSRSLQGVLFKVYQISVLILLKKILFSFFSVCLPLFIRHIAAMLLRKTSSKTMQTVTNYLLYSNFATLKISLKITTRMLTSMFIWFSPIRGMVYTQTT